MRPLAIDLYTGLHGWADGLIAAGWRVVGFDLEDMSKLLGEPKPEHFSLVIQDVLTLHGSQFKDAGLIVGSSPCTKYSYMAMPWTRSKALAAWYREDPARQVELNALYDAQFRIQREASEAAGRHIPMVVENVRGAIPWVGRSRANFGSYHLWGDVPALMPIAFKDATKKPGFKLNPDGTWPQWNEGSGRKIAGFRFDGSGRSFQSAAVAEARKGAGAGAGAEWFGANLCQLPSASPRRKAASAKIARIPFQLAYWIGRYAATPAPQRMEPVR